MTISLHAPCEEIDQILWTQAASCPHVVVESGGVGLSATDIDVPNFEERASEREARISVGAGVID